MEAPTCDVRAMVLAVPIIPLACQLIAFCRGVSRVGALGFAGPLRTAPAPNATGPARCHGLICRFAAGPGEPQPINGSDEQMFGRNEQNPGAGSMRLNGIGPTMCEREECVSSEASPHTQSEDGRV